MGDQITLEDWLNEEIEVCDKCLRACCWHGLFMCDDSAIAGTIKKKRRDLVALGLEHSDYMVVDGESEHLYVTPKPVGTCNCEYVKHEDHLKAIAEAKKEGAREILNKALRFECKEIDCSNCLEENDIVCAINGIVRTYGVDEVIKKVEGI